MPAPAITNLTAGYMAKEEVTYGTAIALTAGTDGIFPYLGDGLPDPPTELEHLFDGSLGNSVSSLLPLAATTPKGRRRQQSFPVLFKGAGTAYTSSAVKVGREVDLMLKACGMTPTFTTDHWNYVYGAGSSLTVGTYAQGLAHIMAGVYADWSYEANGLGAPIHTFALQGIGALPTTLTLPSITYQYTTILPPVAAGSTIVIGSFLVAVAKSVKFKLGRQISGPRQRISDSDGNLGHVALNAVPEMTFMIEQTALQTTPFHNTSGLDVNALLEAATAITVSHKVGSTATNQYTVTLANAQLKKAVPSQEDGVAMWELTFRGTGTTALDVKFD